MTKTNETANRALAFILDAAQKNPGHLSELARRLSQRTGKKIHRQLVDKWFHEDPAQRVEPKLGIGLIIIDEGKKLFGLEDGPVGSLKKLFTK